MTDNIINSKNSQKMSVYCKTCVCKSCEQVAWLEQENAELKALVSQRDASVTAQTGIILELKAENEKLKFKLDTVEADYEASEIEIEDLKNKLNLLTTANNHLLELDKYRQKELETKAEATKANIHNLALLSKANKTLQEIKEIVEEWINNDWSCFHCRSNMDEKLQEILDLITKAEEE